MFIRFVMPPPAVPVPMPMILLVTELDADTIGRLLASGWTANPGPQPPDAGTTVQFDPTGTTLTVTIDGEQVFTETADDATSEVWETALVQFRGDVFLIVNTLDALAAFLTDSQVDYSVLLRGGACTIAHVTTTSSDPRSGPTVPSPPSPEHPTNGAR